MAHEFMRSFTDALPLQLTAAERIQACKGLVRLAVFLQERYGPPTNPAYQRGRAYSQPPLWLHDTSANELVTVERAPNSPTHASVGLLATAGEMIRGGSYYNLQSHLVVRFDQAAPGAPVVADEVAQSEIAALHEYAERKVWADAYRPVRPANFIGAVAALGIAVS